MRLEIIVTFLFLALVGNGTEIDTAISECLLHSQACLYIRMSVVLSGLYPVWLPLVILRVP